MEEKKMNYIAHCDGEREQSILEHLQGTAEKAKDFAEVFEKGDWGYCCGMLHDIGKYSDKFQRRIRGEEIKVDHATAGARVCMELGGMYPFLEMCIAGHHAGLSDYGVSTDIGNSSTTLGRRKKKIEDFYAYKKEVKIPELKTSPVNVEKTKDLNFSLSMFTRMMYSCLVDADFLDTEEFMTEERSGRQQGQVGQDPYASCRQAGLFRRLPAWPHRRPCSSSVGFVVVGYITRAPARDRVMKTIVFISSYSFSSSFLKKMGFFGF